MEKFWSRVERKDEQECWLWCGVVHQSGYGHFKHQGQCFKAHRVAYALTYGEIEWTTGRRGSRGLLVLHKCDNRSCVNPNHLFLGTQRDNMADCSVKSRIGHGSTHGLVKLTESDVAEIKAMHAQGVIGRPGRGWSKAVRSGEAVSMAKVGARYGVSGKTIEMVLRRRAWVGVGEPGEMVS